MDEQEFIKRVERAFPDAIMVCGVGEDPDCPEEHVRSLSRDQAAELPGPPRNPLAQLRQALETAAFALDPDNDHVGGRAKEEAFSAVSEALALPAAETQPYETQGAEAMAQELETQRCLVLSTRHIPRSVNDWLIEHCRHTGIESCSIVNFGFGWLFVWLGAVDRYPAELTRVLQLARSRGFDMLKLDRDGGVISCLPTFDW